MHLIIVVLVVAVMVTRYGFSERLGLRTFGEEQGNPYLGNIGEIRNYSEEMAQAIDQGYPAHHRNGLPARQGHPDQAAR